MDFRILGPQALNGSVSVSGAKNSATRILAAAFVSDGRVTLRNFPLALKDAKAKMAFLADLGVKISQRPDQSELSIAVPNFSLGNIQSFDLPIRTTYLLAAGMLARCGRARVPYPGGCKIGSRGYDLHIMVWRELGCEVEERVDHIEIRGKIRGGRVDFPISTVGGTENALICGAVAEGETLIRNAYVTPEVYDLIAFLREMGAHIDLEGTSLIRIQGKGSLLGDASFSIMPDRIEALTWIILSAVTEGTVFVHNVPFDTMAAPFLHLRDAGLDIFSNSRTVMVSLECIGTHGIQPFELATGTHPGVISDMQAFFTFLGLFANGRSVVFDYRYPERIAYAKELSKFAPGAVHAELGRITVQGPRRLSGAQAESTDLRGSMAQIMAAICAEGESRVSGVELALRGYNALPEKLAALGLVADWHG